MRVVLLGPPGAGKGTQAVLVAKKLGIPHISTGEILRDAVSKKSVLGLKVAAILDSGKLVPDAVVIDLIRERLNLPDAQKGFVLDGFPRTVDQAEGLSQLLTEMKRPLTHVIEFVVPDNVLLERVNGRAQAGSGRTDDNAQVMAKRLQVYWEQTKPVAHYYKKVGTVHEIDGLGAVDEVQARVEAIIKASK